jgi:DNA-directed RNA polymerase specialized sigma24 family protein
VAADALSELQGKAIHRCRTAQAIPAFFRKIVLRECYALLKRFWSSRELRQDDQPADAGVVGAASSDGPKEFLKGLRASLELDPADVDRVLDRAAAAMILDDMERAMFLHHIAGRLTQEDFAAQFSMPMGSVSRLKDRVITKMRRLVGECTGQQP